MRFGKGLLIILGLVFLINVIFAEKISYDIKADLKNAVQHITSVKLQDGDDFAVITSENSNLKIGNVSNVIISKENLSSKNEVEESNKSSVLWWERNRVSSSSSSTVVAWSGNVIKSDYSIINGGENNKIEVWGNNSVIVWWLDNKINQNSESSVILGWFSNDVTGKYSIVAGNNNAIDGDYSVALWSNAIVRWDNSFLWSDGRWETNLNKDSVFVVISENWMVVNDWVAHPWVQLTIGWSLVVSQAWWNESIICGNGEWQWILKLIDKWNWSQSTQKCLCSCDGSNRHSLVWNGQCESVCSKSTNEQPVCGTNLSVTRNKDNQRVYLWTCTKWFPIDESYYVIPYLQDGNVIGDSVYWACQEKNGNVVSNCHFEIKCEWEIPEGAHKNNDIVPSLDPNISRQYRYNEDNSVLCSYSCNDGFFWSSSEKKCKPICNINDSEKCNKVPLITWTKDYNYTCDYSYNGNNYSYRCSDSCEDGKIWDGSSCKNKTEACGSSKGVCNLWISSNVQIDTTSTDLKWVCLDSNWEIIKSCVLTKESKTVVVSYHVSWDKTVWFTIDEAINEWIYINLPYTSSVWNGNTSFIIDAGELVSNKENYGRVAGITLEDPSLKQSIIIWEEKIYNLTLNKNNSKYCAGSCSMAGQCLKGATSSNYTSQKNWNEASFTRKCKVWSTVVEECGISCRINNACQTKPSWAVTCDPVSDSECVSIGGTEVTLDNFYMYSTEEVITSSSCGTKRHCEKQNNQINYTMTTEYCTQTWFKCPSWKVLDGCACVNICNTSSDWEWRCNGWAKVSLPWATWSTSYNYTCTLNSKSYSCSVTCPTGKVYNGNKCVTKPDVCASTHYACMNGAILSEKNDIWEDHVYQWKCTLWAISETCSECYTHYTKQNGVCTPTTLPCEKNTNLNWYSVPALEHNQVVAVSRTDNIQRCTAIARCTNGNITLNPSTDSSTNCKLACNTSVTPWMCNLDLVPSNYNWDTWGYSYTYKCWDFSCGASCPDQNIWNGTSCVSIPSTSTDICWGSVNTCVIWTVKVAISNVSGDTWNCTDKDGKKLNTSVCYRCNESEWYQWDWSKCAKSCTTTDGEIWAEGREWFLYRNWTCPTTCDTTKVAVKCKDGNFVINQTPYPTIPVVYSTCNIVSGQQCSSDYVEICWYWWNCNRTCIWNSATNNICTPITKYKFNGCDVGYILYNKGWQNLCLNNIITIYDSNNQPRYFLREGASDGWSLNVYYELSSDNINATRTELSNNCWDYGLRSLGTSCYNPKDLYWKVVLNWETECVWYMDTYQKSAANATCESNNPWNIWCENTCKCATNC